MKRPKNPLQALWREVRKGLSLQLDTILRTETTLPDGTRGTVLDDICARSLAGYGFSVSISVRHPMETGRTEEDPSLASEIEVIR